MTRLTSTLILFVALIQPLRVWGEASVARTIEIKDGVLIYLVNERAPSLSAIARELYGDRRMAVQIARWNGLDQEARLMLGDRLKIEVRPRFSPEQGTALLIRYWQVADRPKLVARLKALSSSSAVPVARAPINDWPLKGWPPILGGHLPGFERAVKATAVAAKPVASPQYQKAVVAQPPASVQSTVATQPAAAETVAPIKRRSASVSDDETEDGKREPKSDGYWLGKDAAELIEKIGRRLGLSNTQEESK